jgi:hypothetical protein
MCLLPAAFYFPGDQSHCLCLAQGTCEEGTFEDLEGSCDEPAGWEDEAWWRWGWQGEARMCSF